VNKCFKKELNIQFHSILLYYAKTKFTAKAPAKAFPSANSVDEAFTSAGDGA
jgi:hypothetical protein